MKISLEWVDELVNIKTAKLDYLIEKLTLGGFEVEEILEMELNNQKTISLDISATANRSDSLSLQGMSKEIASLLGEPIRDTEYSVQNFSWQTQFERSAKTITDERICSAFSCLIVENLTNLTSPKWLKQKLITSGLVPENTLLDFQNYLLLETGYPFEIYDLNSISSKAESEDFSLTLTKSKHLEQEIFCTTNGSNYGLDRTTTIIQANEVPISIAGIIAEKSVSCFENTNSILIEGSIFKAAQIRQQSRFLGLQTDRAARYEKSINDAGLDDACYRLISLLRLSNPYLTCRLHTVTKTEKSSFQPIFLRYEIIKNILGPIQLKTEVFNNEVFISPQVITQYLERLEFDQTYNEARSTWTVRVPYSRSEDIIREIDLVEEIGRLHGFDNFVTQLPKIKRIGIEDYSYQLRKKVTSCLSNMGLTELIHYSLVNPETYLANKISLLNPLLNDYSNLRASLLPNLIQTMQENLKQQNLSLESFEYGHVFFGNSPDNVQEKEFIAGLFGNRKRKLSWGDPITSMTWFEAKGKMEQFFKKLNLLVFWKPYFSTKYASLFHPIRTGELFISKKKSLGIFGQINPLLAKKLNLTSDLFLFELDLELIRDKTEIKTLKIYKKYSSYPKIVKDLSFVISNQITFQCIKNILYLNGSQLLTKIDLLDHYQGKGVPEDQSSLCLQLTFQSNVETLQHKDIDIFILHLQSILTLKFNALIRG